MNILISGSTGLIGRALSKHLTKQGHTVYPLHRNPKTKELHYWRPEENLIHLDETIKIDSVIHLAGENIADSRWTKDKKNKIVNSRVHGTRLLAEHIASLKSPPSLFISASAIGYYGDTGSNLVNESSNRGSGFLSDISVAWEAATLAVEEANIRTIHLRTGVVLSPEDGVLKKMLLPFKLGLGGIIGNGQQYMSWISVNDIVKIIERMINDEKLSGPYNLVAPQAVTNHTFTKALGHTLHRPTIFPLPAFIARLMFGEMADALLLSSSRVSANRLTAIGYEFIDDEINKTLSHLLNNKA